MKILVITFSQGINPGTFMQAYGVKTAMKEAFPNAEVEFLAFDDFKSHKVTKLPDRSYKTLFFQKLYAAFRLINYRKLLKKEILLTKFKFDLFEYDLNIVKKEFENFDLVVIGSDTILEVAFKGDTVGLNWLSKDVSVPKVFFAASASPANFSLDNGAVQNELKENVEAFISLGFRDDLTTSLVIDRIGVRADRVFKQPDPTYFLDVKQFDLSEKYVKKLRGKKVALYNFNSNFPLRRELAELLKRSGYTLVSTFYNPYADYQIATVDALGWAGVFKYCDLVVTERFHDSVFSLRNAIPVIAIDWDKERFSDNGDSKTLRILEDYDLQRFHFNLSDVEDLGAVEEAITNAENWFNKSAVEKRNLEFVEKSRRILTEIKQAFDE